MQELVEQLVKLQALELDRARLHQELRALPAEVARAQAAVTAAQQRSAEASAVLGREENLRTRLDREIDSQRQKAARFRTQLDAVKTPEQAAAIEHEIQFATAEIDRMENDDFASLERTEAKETELALARAQVELLAAELETVQATAAARTRQLQIELAALDVDRENVRAQIDPGWLDRFDRLASARGTGIARADKQQCTGCRMGLRPQTWNQLREGELLTCDSCSRLLYWDPAFAPQPKEPQPATVPGQGRPVRKPSQAGA